MKAKVKSAKALIKWASENDYFLTPDGSFHKRIASDYPPPRLIGSIFDLCGWVIDVSPSHIHNNAYSGEGFEWCREWFEWIEPSPEEWPIDARIRVSNDPLSDINSGYKRYFAGLVKNTSRPILAWNSGKTSWSVNHDQEHSGWRYVALEEGE